MKRGQARLGALWLGLYVLLAVLPLAIVLAGPLLGPTPPKRSFWIEFSVALGFLGLSMMCLQFVLTARFRVLKSPYGSDVVYAFHRAVSLVSVALVLAHPLILLVVRPEDTLRRLNIITAPWPGKLGVSAVVCLLVLVVISVFRSRLGIGYDWWRRTHAALGVLAVALAVGHIVLIGHYLSSPAQRALWLAYTLAWVGLLVWVRLVKPAVELASPYEVESVTPERGGAWTLALRPVGHAGFAFSPGQFAWITAFSSPFSDREHPFSFSGSAADAPRLRFTIKELGDFTARIKTAQPGDKVYVDGPFGALSSDRHPDADSFVFIAGGIGITPMISHLRTFADRGESRPCVLIYASNTWDGVTFREELDELAKRLPALSIVHVLARPHDGWTGESGFVTRDLLARRRPRGASTEWFICGPPVMMDAVERALAELNVELGSYHAERFNLV
jgi:predicted ferric reductase